MSNFYPLESVGHVSETQLLVKRFKGKRYSDQRQLWKNGQSLWKCHKWLIQGSYASWKTWKIAILFSRTGKLMKFEKNAKTHGKLMEKIIVNKKML